MLRCQGTITHVFGGAILKIYKKYWRTNELFLDSPVEEPRAGPSRDAQEVLYRMKIRNF
jgi:hypothetical protein